MKLSRLLWTTAAVALFAGCTKSPNNQTVINSPSSEAGLEALDNTPGTNSIQFVDEAGQPLVGAKILIGYDVNDPFKGNELVTDTSGLVSIPSDWKVSLPLTVVSNGHVRTTFDSVSPVTSTYRISLGEGADNLEVKGNTTGFGSLPTDGMADFGLVIPAFTQKKLMHFDISAVISPSVDTIRVAGQKLDLPSNLTLPDQTENYMIPIRLSKPRYRTFVRRDGQHKFFALHGRFPFKKVIDDVRGGKSVYDIINHFDFVGGGVTDVPVDKSGGLADMSVSTVNFNSTLTVRAPAFAVDKSLLSLVMSDLGGGLVPTDLKRLLPNQTLNLKTTTTAKETFVLHILTQTQNLAGESPRLAVMSTDLEEGTEPQSSEPQASEPTADEGIRILAGGGLNPGASFNQLTFALQRSQNTNPPTFLDMVAPPQIEPNLIRLKAPPAPAGISPVATYLVLSEVEEIMAGKVKSERRTRLWELFSPTWVDAVKLPTFTLNRLPNRKYRWEVMYVGRTADTGAGNTTLPGADLLEGITHVTRNAADF